jgi:hypothetical protein
VENIERATAALVFIISTTTLFIEWQNSTFFMHEEKNFLDVLTSFYLFNIERKNGPY